jgi:hypothetical protein
MSEIDFFLLRNYRANSCHFERISSESVTRSWALPLKRQGCSGDSDLIQLTVSVGRYTAVSNPNKWGRREDHNRAANYRTITTLHNESLTHIFHSNKFSPQLLKCKYYCINKFLLHWNVRWFLRVSTRHHRYYGVRSGIVRQQRLCIIYIRRFQNLFCLKSYRTSLWLQRYFTSVTLLSPHLGFALVSLRIWIYKVKPMRIHPDLDPDPGQTFTWQKF